MMRFEKTEIITYAKSMHAFVMGGISAEERVCTEALNQERLKSIYIIDE